MPCDQVITNSIDLGKMNEKLLERALKSLGARTYGGVHYFTLDGVSCRIQGNKLVVPEGSEHLADKLKRAYSVETVKYTAQRNGWTIKKVAEWEYEVSK